ncbi:ilvR, partial [Symbiodinium sp. KB8]
AAERPESSDGRFRIGRCHVDEGGARAAGDGAVDHGVDERRVDGIEALLGDDRSDPIEIGGEQVVSVHEVDATLMNVIDLRQLELKHLVALDAVAAEGTFARAADRLGYTQSAVSQQIAALERLLGVPVFDRPGGPRPVVLTPLGAELLERSRELLARVDAMSLELDLFRTGSAGKLSIGTFQSASAMLLPKIVARMRQQFPSIEMHVIESDDEEVLIKALSTGEVEVSFLVGEAPSDAESVHLFDDPFVLVARPDQFSEGPVRPEQFADEPMIGQHPNACQLAGEAGLRAPAWASR